MTAGVRVSVIVPCRNEREYIERCLECILDGDFPGDALEILVVDGRSDDGTRSIVWRYAAQFPTVRLLDNPLRVVPAALNIGIRAARGDIVARMDAHTLYPPYYLSRLVRALETSGADNVGGRIVTLPAARTAVARGIALALGHPLGVGNAYFRIGTPRRRWVDTVPFGCYRREVFDRVGLFDEELIRNQDDEFNQRLVRHGGRILLLPDVVSYYYARATLPQLARTYYQYGLYKPLAARKGGGIRTLRQLAPITFLAAVVGLGIGGLAWPPAAVLWRLVTGFYLAAVAWCSVGTARRLGARTMLALGTAFAVLHFSYAVGWLRGLWRLVPTRTLRREDPTLVPLSR